MVVGMQKNMWCLCRWAGHHVMFIAGCVSYDLCLLMLLSIAPFVVAWHGIRRVGGSSGGR